MNHIIYLTESALENQLEQFDHYRQPEDYGKCPFPSHALESKSQEQPHRKEHYNHREGSLSGLRQSEEHHASLDATGDLRLGFRRVRIGDTHPARWCQD